MTAAEIAGPDQTNLPLGLSPLAERHDAMRTVGSDDEDSQDGRASSIGSDLPYRLKLGTKWQALGPFPSGMREHPMMSSPLAAYLCQHPGDDEAIAFARLPYDETHSWPSELGTGGRVGWKTFEAHEDGWLNISYPDINWKQLRADHGWAALQYQAILRTTLHVTGSSWRSNVLVDMVQGAEYAFISQDEPTSPTVWYNGDLYAYADTPAGRQELEPGGPSRLARQLCLRPGDYTVLVRALYEIRMFGDSHDGPPTIRIRPEIWADGASSFHVVDGVGIIPHVVDGWIMGDWLSMTAESSDGDTQSMRIVKVQSRSSSVRIKLLHPVTLVPGQRRPVPLRIRQTAPIGPFEFNIELEVYHQASVGGYTSESFWYIPLKHHSSRNATPFQMTHAISRPGTLPPQVSYATVVPPHASAYPSTSSAKPPVVLSLHGAGVDVAWPQVAASMPRRKDMWAVCPTGKNEWGEDWHGASMADAWHAREALPTCLRKIGVEVSDKTLLIGHSNGGQGAWHLAARYPDKVVGVIAAAGYTKIQDYVPYLHLTSQHFADPALMGIMMASLTPYNNDLHLSNLAHVPLLVIHGGADDNVPPRHSRSQVALLSAWQGKDSVKLVEVPGKPHFWDEIFHASHVGDFIDSIPERPWEDDRKNGFTLTTANPEECGGRAGIRIVELDIPGRLGRLDVNARQWSRERGPGLDLRGTNVKRIAVTTAGREQILTKTGEDWLERVPAYQPRVYGPMIRMLAGEAPLAIVVGSSPQHMSIAKRLAHDLYVYHRSDAGILSHQEALEAIARTDLPGNVVIIGRPEENRLADYVLRQDTIPLTFPTRGVMLLADRLIYEQGAGIISLLPHPIASVRGLACIIAGNDPLGLELAARLFPIRTGVPIPDWAIVGAQSQWRAAGGFIGAGFWNGEWKWSEAMSWIDR